MSPVAALAFTLSASGTWPAAEFPHEHVALPPPALGQHEVSADFDRDQRPDVARLFHDPQGRRVSLWMRLGNGRAFPLEVLQDSPTSRSLTLAVRSGGDPTCPRIVDGVRECGRSWWVRHNPSLVVLGQGGEEYVWHWNNYVFMREEVFP